jgi:hypothetical protein
LSLWYFFKDDLGARTHRFYVESVYVSEFIVMNNMLKRNIEVEMIIFNPNPRMHIYYENQIPGL